MDKCDNTECEIGCHLKILVAAGCLRESTVAVKSAGATSMWQRGNITAAPALFSCSLALIATAG